MLLLDGIHPGAAKMFEADGYSRVESHDKALPDARRLALVSCRSLAAQHWLPH